MKENQRGSILALVALAAAAIAILAMVISKTMTTSSREYVYMDNMKKVYTFSEAAMHDAVSQLIYNPDACGNLTVHGSVNPLPGFSPNRYVYESTCTRVTTPIDGVYYVAISATMTVRGLPYSERLHTYVSVSNVSAYFAAINGNMTVDNGSNIATGRIYASDTLTFSPGALMTQVGQAEYSNACNPDPTNPVTNTAYCPNGGCYVTINSPPMPTKILPLLFPQMTAGELERFKDIALVGGHTYANVFKGHVYPPGYNGAYTDPVGQDFYTTHSTSNADHVYFFNGDIHVGDPSHLMTSTTIYGQTEFVASGDIYLHGDIFTSNDSTILDGMAGTYSASSSTAHQAVFIPGPDKNVYIATEAFDCTSGVDQRQYIHAYVFAPSGQFVANSGPGWGTCVDHRYLNFVGSMILGGSPSFPGVGNGKRTYAFEPTLLTNPPPYMPSLTVIHNEFAEITSQTGPFDPH